MRGHPVSSGLDYLARRQSEQGSLRGELDGPLFFLPFYIFAHYATKTPLSPDHRSAFTNTCARCGTPTEVSAFMSNVPARYLARC